MYIPFTFSLKHGLLKLSVLARNGRRVGYSFSLRDETHLKIVLFLILCIGGVGDLHMQCNASRVQEMALDSWNWDYRNCEHLKWVLGDEFRFCRNSVDWAVSVCSPSFLLFVFTGMTK